MEVAKIIREDYLHQNAFHEIDTYASLNKQYNMLKLIKTFYDESRLAVENYADLDEILALSCKEKIGRSKYIEESNLNEFDEILRQITTEIRSITHGEEDND